MSPAHLLCENQIQNNNMASLNSEILNLINAIEQCNLSEINYILSTTQTHEFINLQCGALRVTPIHVASALEHDNAGLVIDMLLNYGASAEATDRLGRTALHHAASIGNYDVVLKLVNAGTPLDTKFEVNSCQTITEYVSDFAVTKQFPVPDCWGRTALHQAVKYCHAEIVKLLVSRGANVNIADEHGTTPLLLAGAGVYSGNEEQVKAYELIVHCLVAGGADVNVLMRDTKTTALHHAVMIRSPIAVEDLLRAGAKLTSATCGETPLHDAAGHGDVQILTKLLEYTDCSEIVNKSDTVGRTPLHRAAYCGSGPCLCMLLDHGGNLAIETHSGATVVDAILANMPRPLHFLNEVMNKYITCNHTRENDVDFKIRLDYRLLTPQGSERQMAAISALLSAGTENQRNKILQHPLVETYLIIKWQRLRWFFFLFLFIHVIFVFSFSLFILLSIHNFTVNKNFNSTIQNSTEVPETDTSRAVFALEISRYILFFSAAWLTCHVLLQGVLVPRHFLRQYEFYLNLLCGALSLAVALAPQTPTGEDQPWTLHAMSVGVLLAWIQLMLLIGRLPTYGYYALMFSTVLQNVIKVLMTFICLVIGFALSFSVQFHTSEHFQYPWRSLVKTTVMMMGEFEYADMFNDDSTNSNGTRLPATSRFIFLLFIILASIVLMNLMVGLAVSDIQGLLEEGHVRRLAKQADFLTHLEKMTSHKILKNSCFPKRFHELMNSRRCIPSVLTIQPGPASGSVRAVKLARLFSLNLLETIVLTALNNQPYCSPKQTNETEDKGNTNEEVSLREIKETLEEMRSEIAKLSKAMKTHKDMLDTSGDSLNNQN